MKRILFALLLITQTKSSFIHNLECTSECSQTAQKFIEKCIPAQASDKELFIIRMYLVGLYTSLKSQPFGELNHHFHKDSLQCTDISLEKQDRINSIVKKIHKKLKKINDTPNDIIEQLRAIIECLHHTSKEV